MQDTSRRADPEFVHKARVAVRRMRAALRVFRSLIEESAGEESAGEPRARRARKALKTLGSVLGEARDWDVIETELMPARRALLAQALGPAAALLIARKARAAQARGNAAARKLVASARFEAMLLDVDQLRLALEKAPVAAAAQAGDAAALRPLARQRKRIRQLAVRLPRLDKAERHKLRIECKRLRYAVELCAPAFPCKGGRKWLRALESIQDVLGKATDAHMLANRIGGLDPAAGRALEESARDCVRKQTPKAAALFRAWRKARAPWTA